MFPSEPDPSDRPSEARDNYREPGRSYYGSIHQIEKRDDGYHPRQMYKREEGYHPNIVDKRDDGYQPRLMYKREDGYHPGMVYDPFNPWGDHKWSPTTIREDTTVTTTAYRSNNDHNSTTQYRRTYFPVGTQDQDQDTTTTHTPETETPEYSSKPHTTHSLVTPPTTGPFYVNKDLRLLNTSPARRGKVAQGSKNNTTHGGRFLFTLPSNFIILIITYY